MSPPCGPLIYSLIARSPSVRESTCHPPVLLLWLLQALATVSGLSLSLSRWLSTADQPHHIPKSTKPTTPTRTTTKPTRIISSSHHLHPRPQYQYILPSRHSLSNPNSPIPHPSFSRPRPTRALSSSFVAHTSRQQTPSALEIPVPSFNPGPPNPIPTRPLSAHSLQTHPTQPTNSSFPHTVLHLSTPCRARTCVLAQPIVLPTAPQSLAQRAEPRIQARRAVTNPAGSDGPNATRPSTFEQSFSCAHTLVLICSLRALE